MLDNRKGNVWVWVGVVVLVIIIVLFFVWKPGPSTNTPAPTVPQPVYAPTGQLVPGFPASLVLDSSAQISKSYSINYSPSTNQYTAEWNSSSSLAAETAEYQKYLKANGWTVTTNPVREATLRGIYATNPTNILLVNIVTHGTGSQVTVSYGTP